jgi:hypothetical protein
MTISAITKQLYDLAVGHYFNGEKFTQNRLQNYITRMMSNSDRLIMTIALPDGWWYFSINRYSKRIDGLDYTIPDNREQEQRIKEALLNTKR